jgi:hypothetical protein
MAQLRGSLYHIYHLPILVMHLNAFDMEHITYVWDSFFNMDSTVMIGLPYLAIISGMLDMKYIIYVQDSFFNMNSTVMFVL